MNLSYPLQSPNSNALSTGVESKARQKYFMSFGTHIIMDTIQYGIKIRPTVDSIAEALYHTIIEYIILYRCPSVIKTTLAVRLEYFRKAIFSHGRKYQATRSQSTQSWHNQTIMVAEEDYYH